MSVRMSSRMLVAAALVGAVSLVGASGPAAAQQHPQQDAKQHGPKPPEQKKEKDAQSPPKAQKAPKPKPEPPGQARQMQARLPQQQQEQLIGQQQRRLAQYRDQMIRQQHQAPQQAAELQRQHRGAQYGLQQQYTARLYQQQLRFRNAGNHYNYSGDPYFYTPPSYRYSRGGSYYETNEYGAAALRQAVSSGYEQGLGTGRADRQDHWAYDYRQSYAYQDGIYGYRGFYIEPEEYQYYFRQGFYRGYEDGYYGRHRYGVSTPERSSVLGDVLSGILNLQSFR
jgi:hypothetical protein